MEFVPQHK